MRRAVFLDRDGVLNRLVYRPGEGVWDSPYSLEEFGLLPGVTTALRSMRRLGFLLFVVSNQPGVAKGKCLLDFLAALDRKMQILLGQEGSTLDGIYYCLHHPAAVVQSYRVNCDCRKPKPGLILKAAAEHQIELQRSYMVGDRMVDVQAGRLAGCRTILITKSPVSPEGPELGRDAPERVADDLRKAAELLEEDMNRGAVFGYRQHPGDQALARFRRAGWGDDQSEYHAEGRRL